ncbi:MAG: 23S rRNA (adenine(2503)-C(2))-methyltransferase RlmN [Deltaproteobacteria bacterium]|nr:23S rRNA (adenine(2503)-C(2))-methyltransferase RlmN [Deltaproteobacteria bacterium]
MTQKKNIKNIPLDQLAVEFSEMGLEGYRARQVRQWLYQKDAGDFSDMTNISKVFREKLDEVYEIPRFKKLIEQTSNDGTKKFLFEMGDGNKIESVWIPAENRRTLCVSTQVGCGMACDFCLTGELGLKRNLSVYEIVEQIAAVKRALPEDESITNLVFMGMGEPLANPKSLYPALNILLDPECFNFSRHHVTVSTSGLAPEIEKFGDKTPVKLAISLNATTDEVRDVVMPINKKYNIERLLEACKNMKLHKRNAITFEYVMLHGVNDTLDDAKRLVRILSKLKAKVNLLPFNEYPESPYKRPDDEWVHKFQKILLNAGYIAVVRKSRGRDILGACGQLATHEKALVGEAKSFKTERFKIAV